MICPYCVNDITKVKGTITNKNITHRFRQCPKCFNVWMTIEANKNDTKFWRKYNKSLRNDKDDFDTSLFE